MTKIARMSQMMAFFFAVSVISGNAQKADAYIHEMGQALRPFGSIEAPNCHNVEVHPASTLGGFVLASGQNEQGEVLWNIYTIDVIRFNFDMSDLDEDKVRNDMVISLSSFSKHEKGTPYPVPDLAVVMIPAINGVKKITVHAVDLDKLNGMTQQGSSQLTESNMGAKTEQRAAVLISFSDKDRADAFVNALKKAIIACKAQ
jgi:hypothetical protein